MVSLNWRIFSAFFLVFGRVKLGISPKRHSWNFGFILQRERATANPADRSTRARAGTLPPAPVDGQPKITVNNDVPNT